jgi:hypothetical protein
MELQLQMAHKLTLQARNFMLPFYMTTLLALLAGYSTSFAQTISQTYQVLFLTPQTSLTTSSKSF